MKLSEQAEWLERNYDQYTLTELKADPGHGIDRMTSWWPSWDLEFEVRSEAGFGPSHRQPMFTLKDSRSPGDQWRWSAELDFVPLSRESEKAKLWEPDDA